MEGRRTGSPGTEGLLEEVRGQRKDALTSGVGVVRAEEDQDQRGTSTKIVRDAGMATWDSEMVW